MLLPFRIVLVCSLAFACMPLRGHAGDGPKPVPVRFDIETFTYANVDLSPNDETLLFDALGTLYTVPVEGGMATAITHGDSWNVRARYSPDGTKIGFLSDRSGRFDPWIASASGASPKPVDMQGNDVSWMRRSRLSWTPDGNLMLAGVSPKGPLAWIHEQGSGLREMSNITSEMMARGVTTPDGKSRYYGGDALYRLDTATGNQSVAKSHGDGAHILKLALSGDGNTLFYFVKPREADTSVDSPATLHAAHLPTNVHKRLDQASKDCRSYGRMECDIPDYAASFDGSAVFINLDGRVVRIDTASGNREVVPITASVDRSAYPGQPKASLAPPADGRIRANAIRWPDISPDRSRVAFNAFARIHVRDLRNGKIMRIAEDAGPYGALAISPDGKRIAFTTWPGKAGGHVMIVAVDGGDPVKVTDQAGWYTNPVWSHDGSRIAFISDNIAGQEHAYAPPLPRKVQLQVVDADKPSGARTIGEFMPAGWGSTRVYPQPTFLHGDKRIYLIARSDSPVRWGELPASVISFVIDTGERIDHLPVPRFDEAVVSPDGKHLAFVAQGELRLLSLQSGQAQSEPVDPGKVRRIGAGTPIYVKWQGPEHLVWADARSIYTYRLGEDRPEEVHSVAVTENVFRPTKCVVYRRARLLTMTDPGVIEGGDIKVCGDRIAEIGHVTRDPDDDVLELDMAGATIVPGIVDVHGHFNNFYPEIWPLRDVGYIGSLAYGVTTIYDPQASTVDVAARAELFDIGDATGPRLLGAGTGIMGSVIDGSDHYHMGTRISRPHIETVVASRAKYVTGPLKSYDNPRRDTRRMLAEAAREAGTSVTSHPYSLEDALSSALDGISIEHRLDIGRSIQVHDDVLQFIAATGVVHTLESGGAGRYPIDVPQPRLDNLFSTAFLELVERELEEVGPREQRREPSRTLVRLTQMGGLGALASHGNFLPGLAMHHNLWALVDDGLEPYEAFRVATLNGARKLGMDAEIGSLEPGKLADFIVLRGNPLEDIRNSADVKYVVKGGVVYDSDTMEVVHPGR